MILLLNNNNNNSNNNTINNNSKCKKVNCLKRKLLIISFLFITFIQMAATEENISYFTSDSCPIFTSKFYKTAAEEIEGNIISSPISIHLLLSFLTHGAKGETIAELINNLLIKNTDDLSSDYKNLISNFNTIKNVELHIANAAYLSKNVELLSKFKTFGIDFYNFTVSKINFEDKVSSADQINSWIMEKTKDKIADIISPDDITEDTKMILVNAIYFKGSWKFPFDQKYTTDQPFFITELKHNMVPTMKTKVRYAHGDLPQLDSRFIEIPYTNLDLSMVIILPNKIDGLTSLEQNFDWSLILNAKPTHQEIVLNLPRFKIKSTLNLQPILNKIGIKRMFENGADFSGISEAPVKVSRVIQKAFLEVNEEGSEAAAATLMQIRLRRMVHDPEVFEVNHPFMVAIRHKLSDIPLFIGRVQNIDVHPSRPDQSRDEL